MIIGLGTDIINISRIEKVCKRYEKRFLTKFFTNNEQEDFANILPQKKINKIAKYFAAKEATAKALGTGFNCGIEWKNVEVFHDELGAPLLNLSGLALERALELSEGKSFQTLLSLSDDYPFAQAVVIIEKI